MPNLFWNKTPTSYVKNIALNKKEVTELWLATAKLILFSKK